MRATHEKHGDLEENRPALHRNAPARSSDTYLQFRFLSPARESVRQLYDRVLTTVYLTTETLVRVKAKETLAQLLRRWLPRVIVARARETCSRIRTWLRARVVRERILYVRSFDII